MTNAGTRIINVKQLADGTGRVCIHWFRLDPAGPITTPVGAIMAGQFGPMKMGGERGWIACHPEQTSVLPVERGGETLICTRSDDPRAVTCPACIATVEYQEANKRLDAAILAKAAS